MKKMNEKNQRGFLQFIFMVIGALLGPLVGWQVTGWTSFHYYLHHQTMSVLIWLAIGLIAGLVLGVVVADKAVKGESDKDKQ